MIAVTIDTNLLASGLIAPESYPGQILAAWRRRDFRLVLSEHVLGELARVLQEPYFTRRLTPGRQAEDLAVLRRYADVTALTIRIQGVATHPEDDLILATALSGKAQFLVTGDYKLVELKEFRGLILVTARAFLSMLSGLATEDR